MVQRQVLHDSTPIVAPLKARLNMTAPTILRSYFSLALTTNNML